MTLDNKEKSSGTEPNFRLLPTATQLLPFLWYHTGKMFRCFFAFLLLKIPIGLSFFPLFF
ncbi:Uncharacterized protein APZ42_028000 [Daphnia magna]|uniref:Uncharacterized protein n=1 Tax=Daphnia magna TaxID=35525 RepID=A0A164QWR0_9CRUS|nr:Uncharacterized protein APZ42_028000 [Daphnia magna]